MAADERADGAGWSVSRRTLGRWAIGAAGAAAAAAGVAVWRLRDAPVATTGATAGDAPGAAASAPADGASAFWQSRFVQPDGARLIEMASLRGSPLVLNFWATWCPPCVQEMPEIDRFAREHAAKGVRVVGLAIDNPSAVRSFLAKMPVHYLIGLAGFDGSELARQLGNTGGGLPFTVVFDRGGRIVQRRMGVTSHAELGRWVSPL